MHMWEVPVERPAGVWDVLVQGGCGGMEALQLFLADNDWQTASTSSRCGTQPRPLTAQQDDRTWCSC